MIAIGTFHLPRNVPVASLRQLFLELLVDFVSWALNSHFQESRHIRATCAVAEAFLSDRSGLRPFAFAPYMDQAVHSHRDKVILYKR
jgi:hypothetical protein